MLIRARPGAALTIEAVLLIHLQPRLESADRPHLAKGERCALHDGGQPRGDVLRFVEECWSAGMLDRRLRARRGATAIPMRLLVRRGDGRAEPDVRRLLRHRVEILSMPRILVALGVGRLMLVIGMIAIHG